MSYRPLCVTASVAALLALSGPASADFVILDDLIVDGSACIGFDCVNGESFGFDTIRLKENNLRIKFEDTSSTASFPTTDWTLVANDSANGGQNKFSILDSSTNRTIFTVEGNAPSNSLYVDDGGRVGFGTSIPVADLHIKTGNTPTLRLEQDGTSGFSPQTFDVASNEANFFVRDATNGSTLPLRIRPGSPSNAIYIDPDGDVAMGHTNPTSALHIERSNETAQLHVEEASGTTGARTLILMTNNGAVRTLTENTNNGAQWLTTYGGDIRIAPSDNAADQVFLLDAAGNLTIQGNLVTGGGGTCDPGPCDRVFDPDFYTVPTIEEHAAYMWANKRLPALDPTRPGEPINITLKLTRMLNELEHAHIFIERLNTELKAQGEEIAAQRAVIEELQSEIAEN